MHNTFLEWSGLSMFGEAAEVLHNYLILSHKQNVTHFSEEVVVQSYLT